MPAARRRPLAKQGRDSDAAGTSRDIATSEECVRQSPGESAPSGNVPPNSLGQPDEGVASQQPVASKADQRACVKADARLVAQCVTGDVGAWEELFTEFRAPLLSAIRSMLPASRRDPHQAEEVAAAVWLALVEDDGELLRKFDAKRGVRLITFLRAIGRDYVARHVRSEQRRLTHEAASASERRSFDSPDPGPEFSEFLASLDPEEREYLGEFLSDEDQEALGEFCGPSSRTSLWRLANAIKKKVRGYFGGQ